MQNVYKLGLQYVQCVQARSSQTGASRGASQAIPEARKLQITNVEGGRFSLRRNPKEKVGIEKEGGVKSKQVQTFNLNMPKHSSTSSAKSSAQNLGRGKNETSFNQIPILQTPQKRKLLVRYNNVPKLVCNFSERARNLPEDYDFSSSESPAKRRRVGGQRGQGQ